MGTDHQGVWFHRRRLARIFHRNKAAEAFDILNQALHGKVISEQEKTTLALLRALSTGQVEIEAGTTARLKAWLQSLLARLEQGCAADHLFGALIILIA